MQDSDMPIIASFLTEDTTTTVLSFAGIPLSSGSIRILFEILETNDTVEVLDLHGCKLTEHDIELLLGLLKKNLKLRCINLDLNDISKSIAKRVSDILAKRDMTTLSMNAFKYLQEMNSTDELRQVHPANECLSWEDVALNLYFLPSAACS